MAAIPVEAGDLES